MPKYLTKVKYHPETIKILMKKGGTARKKHVAESAKSLGGKLEWFYFAFGGTDVYCVFDFPSEVEATALSVAVGARGALGIETVVLISPETMDKAVKKAAGYQGGTAPK